MAEVLHVSATWIISHEHWRLRVVFEELGADET
jgi:hypothetical protein